MFANNNFLHFSDPRSLSNPSRETMEISRDSEVGGALRAITHKKPASRFCLSGSVGAPAGAQLFTLHESFSSDDSAPELVEDDRPESMSSFEDDEYQYHASASQLWDSFWQGSSKAQAGPRDDGPRYNLREESTPSLQLRGCPAPPRRHSEKGPVEDMPFTMEEHGCQRDWERSQSLSLYSVFPRPPRSPPRRPKFADPFPPTSTAPANPPVLNNNIASGSTSYLPTLPNSPPPSPPRRSPARRKPPPLFLQKTLERPPTPTRPSTATDPDAPVSPKSRPQKPWSANAVAPSYLNRPLPPIPPAPSTNPEPQPTSFFDDSDDEDGSPGLAARIKGKFAHRRAISGGRDEEDAGRGSVLARMLRRSRS